MSRDLVVNRFTSTAQGLVPAPGQSVGALLRDDGTWQSFLSVALAGNVTINGPASGITLTVNGVSGQYAQVIKNSGAAGTQSGLEIATTGNAADVQLNCVVLGVQNNLVVWGDGHFQLGYNGSANTIIGSAAGAVTIAAPTSGNTLTVSAPGSNATAGGTSRSGEFLGAPNAYTLEAVGSPTTGQSYGLNIRAGTNSSDTCLNAANASGTALLTVRGDGATTIPGSLKCSSFAMNNQTPVAVSASYGTPTGNVKLANFPGATATLANCSAMIAQLILDLKAVGILGT